MSLRRFAIVTSRFNEEVTSGLLRGAVTYLEEKGCHINRNDLISSPGAFELPVLAQTLAKTGKYSGIICLGAVIKGETAHFEFISLGTTIGIVQAMLNTGTPISFGVLTTYNDEQAAKRSTASMADNKGREAAAACYEAAQTLEQIRKDDINR